MKVPLMRRTTTHRQNLQARKSKIKNKRAKNRLNRTVIKIKNRKNLNTLSLMRVIRLSKREWKRIKLIVLKDLI